MNIVNFVTDHEFEPDIGRPNYCGHVIGCGAGNGCSDAAICDLGLAWHVKSDPVWVPCHGSQHVKLWEEDDAHPSDCESISEAWKRIFGAAMEVALDTFDGGDAFYRLYRDNRVSVDSPCGSAIYQYLPARTY